MAAASQDDWDLDTDEIRSTASDELHETRPNRWRGALSTWRHMTQEERLLHQNMEQVRNQDLAIHLFNAAMLRHPPEGSQDALPEGAGLGEWRPPQAWAAWPLPIEALPREQLLRETHDAHDAFTLRRREAVLPSRVLEEEVSASMLRIAKERFRERRLGEGDELAEGNGEREDESSDDEPEGSGSSGSDEASDAGPDETEEAESSDGSQDYGEQTNPDEAMQNSPDAEAAAPAAAPAPRKHFVPVMSADDDLSYDLLRPSARHILAKLDATLTTLHNARMAGVISRDQNDDSASDRSSVISDAETDASAPSRRTPKSKHAQKRPAPASSPSDDDDADNESVSEGTPRGRPAPLRRRRASKRTLSASSRESDSDAARAYRLWRENRLNRWGLRDWRDVLGAAALAGFDADVVARAAQRCADLFGQSMELKTMVEGQEGYVTTTCRPGMPLAAKEASDGEEMHLEETRRRLRLEAMHQRRARERRAAERTPMGAETEGSDDDESDDDEGAPRSKPRSGLADGYGTSSGAESPAAPPRLSIDINATEASSDGLFYCPVTHCKRHTKGFPAKRGLREHFKLIHDQPTAEKGAFYCPVATCKYHVRSFKAKKNLRAHTRNMHGAELAGGDDEDEGTSRGDRKGKANEHRPVTPVPLVRVPGSEDEMEGAVHVDGFLRPIKIRQGWLSKGGREKGQRNRGRPD